MLQYTAGNGGEVYFDEVKFSVYAPLASVSSSASKVEYQTLKQEFPTNGGKSDFENRAYTCGLRRTIRSPSNR